MQRRLKTKAILLVFITLSFFSRASEIISVNPSPKTIVIPTDKKLSVAKKLRERIDAIILFEEMVLKIIVHNEKKGVLLGKSNLKKKPRESLRIRTLKEIHLKNQIYKLKKEKVIFKIINDIIENFIITKKLVVPLDLLTEILEETELQLLLDEQKTFATEALCQIL